MSVTDILIKNKVLRRGIALVAGAAVGTGTYFLATFVKNKVDEKRAEEDWTEIDFPDIPEGVNEDEYDPRKKREAEDTDKIVSSKYEKPDIVDYTKYSKLVNDCIEGLSKRDETEKADAEESEELEDNPACSFISETEYLDTVAKFAKADATYFTQDRVLAGWNEDLLVRDIPTTVGWKAIKMFDDPSVKSVYVRNSDLKVDYEIVRCDDLFDDVVQEANMLEE